MTAFLFGVTAFLFGVTAWLFGMTGFLFGVTVLLVRDDGLSAFGGYLKEPTPPWSPVSPVRKGGMTVREGRNGGDAKQFKLAKKLHGRAKKTTVQIKIQ